MISRLAPTPNGELHWGNLMNFALTWAMVRQQQGKLWLRFDDVDQARCQSVYVKQSRELLTFLGLNWDEEAKSQIEKIAGYRHLLEEIPHYVCDCSRQEILKRTGQSHYDGHCRNRQLLYEAGKNSIRFFNSDSAQGDFILWRRENIPAYHLTCVYDDMTMAIDTVVRGKDLLESTRVHWALSDSLDSQPLSHVDYFHHALVTSPQGEKLSKSRQHGDLGQKLASGLRASELWHELGLLMKSPFELKSCADLMQLDVTSYCERLKRE